MKKIIVTAILVCAAGVVAWYFSSSNNGNEKSEASAPLATAISATKEVTSTDDGPKIKFENLFNHWQVSSGKTTTVCKLQDTAVSTDSMAPIENESVNVALQVTDENGVYTVRLSSGTEECALRLKRDASNLVLKDSTQTCTVTVSRGEQGNVSITATYDNFNLALNESGALEVTAVAQMAIGSEMTCTATSSWTAQPK